MTTRPFDPIVFYHQTLAPTGKKFTVEAEVAGLGPDWVDTPTKFVPVEPETPEDTGENPETPKEPDAKPKKTRRGVA